MKSFELTQKMMKDMNSPKKLRQMMKKMNLKDSDFEGLEQYIKN